jgi:signal transduction histidine kinase
LIPTPIRALRVPVAATVLDTVLFSSIGDPNHQLSFALVQQPPVWLVGVGALPAVPLLMLRARRPTAVVIGMAVLSATLTVSIGSRPLITVLLALYGVASSASARRAGLGLAAALAAHAVTVAYEVSVEEVSSATVAAVATVFALFDLAAWGLGRRAAAGQLREARLLETRQQLAAEAVAVERLRIARELHDVVASAVTVIVLHSAIARPRVRSNPELVEQALSTIEEMASQAVSELRRLLVVLRAVVQEPDEEAETGRRLGELEHLRRETELAGVQVHIAVQGNLSTLDPSLDLTAYRILQEALTNVTRHAGTGSVVDVRLSLTSDCLVVEVSNTQGAATPDAAIGLSSGFGLVGLRERVSLAGGDLEVGPRAQGGWSLLARLPVGPPDPGHRA